MIDDTDDHGPHLNTGADPYLARRALDAEAERARQLAELEEKMRPGQLNPRARALLRARRERGAAPDADTDNRTDT